MSRRSSVPAYTHHRASGQARVRIAGRDVYLGPYGSAESRERYARLIAERAVDPQPANQFPAPSVADPDLTVGELVGDAHWDCRCRDGRIGVRRRIGGPRS